MFPAVTRIGITLELGGEIAGMIRHPGGSPASGSVIVVTDASGGGLVEWFTSVLSSGKFAAGPLPSGSYEIRAYWSGDVRVRERVDISMGRVSEVELVIGRD